MRTTAVRDGDHYVINGVKRFITGADGADFVILMAATDRSKGSRGGISCFVFDMDTPGVKLSTCYQTLTGETPWEIMFDNVRIHESHLVGEEGKGFSLGQKWLGAGRIKQARARARRHPALPRARDRLCQAARDLRPADRQPAGDLVPAGRHLCRT